MAVDFEIRNDLEKRSLVGIDGLNERKIGDLKERFLADDFKDNFDPQIISDIIAYEDKKMTKIDIVELKNQKYFYEYLQNYPEPWPTDAEADADLKECKAKISQVKDEIDDQKAEIEALAETAEESYNILKMKRQELLGKVTGIEAKIAKLNAVKEKYVKRKELIGEGIPDNVDVVKYKAEQSQKLHSLQNALTTCNSMLNKLENDIEHLTAVCEKHELHVERNREMLKSLHQEREDNNTESVKTFKKQEELLEVLERIGCLKAHIIGNNRIRLEFLEDKMEKKFQFAVIVHFKRNDYGVLRLADVKVDSEILHFEHIIQYAVDHNDIYYLVTQLRERWMSYLPLATEIAQISERYPLDWIEEERLLRLIIGRNGRIWCSLFIPQSYPSSGKITLIDIKGTIDGESVEDLQNDRIALNLQQWVDLLEKKFGNT